MSDARKAPDAAIEPPIAAQAPAVQAPAIAPAVAPVAVPIIAPAVEQAVAPVAPPPVPAPVAEAAPPAQEAPKKASWLSRLKQGLSRTGQSIGGLFVGVKVDENLFEELESALIMADAGLEATEALLTALRAREKERIEDPAKVKAALRQLLADHLRRWSVPSISGRQAAGGDDRRRQRRGKTTSIGKLAHTFQRQGASVLLAAGDVHAAAREQLIEWGSRNNVTVIAQDGGDPAAVAFDAVNAGRARGIDVVMVDTAGRLPAAASDGRAEEDPPRSSARPTPSRREVLLVVDGNTGQNALAQIRAFDAAINLTGLVVTKLDGTAKGWHAGRRGRASQGVDPVPAKGTLAAVAAGNQGVRPVPGVLDRRGRKPGRPAALRGGRVRRGAAGRLITIVIAP